PGVITWEAASASPEARSAVVSLSAPSGDRTISTSPEGMDGAPRRAPVVTSNPRSLAAATSGLTEPVGSSETRDARGCSLDTIRSNPITAAAAAAAPNAPTATPREATARQEPRADGGGAPELRREASRD